MNLRDEQYLSVLLNYYKKKGAFPSLEVIIYGKRIGEWFDGQLSKSRKGTIDVAIKDRLDQECPGWRIPIYYKKAEKVKSSKRKKIPFMESGSLKRKLLASHPTLRVKKNRVIFDFIKNTEPSTNSNISNEFSIQRKDSYKILERLVAYNLLRKFRFDNKVFYTVND